MTTSVFMRIFYRSIERVIFSLLVVFVSACTGSGLANASCEWEEFRSLSALQEKIEAMRKCSESEQLDLYINWSKATMPGNSDLVEVIAEQGERIVPAVMERIETAVELLEFSDVERLLSALVRMHRGGYFEFGNDPILMARLERAVDRIQDPRWPESADAYRQSAEMKLDWLRERQ